MRQEQWYEERRKLRDIIIGVGVNINRNIQSHWPNHKESSLFPVAGSTTT